MADAPTLRKSLLPLPRQLKEQPEVERLPKGMIRQRSWERKAVAARRFKPAS